MSPVGGQAGSMIRSLPGSGSQDATGLLKVRDFLKIVRISVAVDQIKSDNRHKPIRSKQVATESHQACEF